MIKPKMILFDYGQTLVNEVSFDGVKGTEAVLKYAVKNKYNKTAEEVQNYANQLNKEIGRFDPEKRHLFQYEIPTNGIDEFLTFLKHQDIRTAVISNISYSGNAVIKRINDCIPNNDFEFIIATSEYLYRKPNRHIFELALEKAELTSDEVWYVGDQYECDILGAKNSGIFPVWYIGATNSEYESKDDILTINKWDELENYILRL